MTNKEIASEFQLLGQIMELHGENPFKIRSYSNAYLTIRKLPEPLSNLSREQINEMKGIGKAISDKIEELLQTGMMKTLESYKEKTPDGIVQLLGLKGFGPKKIKLVWKELGVESAGELLYACKENRLIDVKGFGAKSQEDLISLLEYFMAHNGKFLYASVEPHARLIQEQLRSSYPPESFEYSGGLVRKMPILSAIEIDTTMPMGSMDWDRDLDIRGLEHVDGQWHIHKIPIRLNYLKTENFVIEHLKNSSSPEFFQRVQEKLPEGAHFDSDAEVFASISNAYIPGELREDEAVLDYPKEWFDDLVSEKSIKGVIHNHSTYSDGVNTLAEMRDRCIELGYQYLLISDHSKSAFYANGLQEDRLRAQWAEIDQLNEGHSDFKIYKGIESDILYDGQLDYDDDILKEFDAVIASVHSNLKMKEEKANARLIKAIENPYTKILGHPTGRLLLSRKGYPIDHKKVIDACAENGVVIELNANPLRLDIDWQWIQYAVSKNVMISINPDAHSTAGIEDIRFGVYVARKAHLSNQMCLNAKTLDEFDSWLFK